ncbi:phosphoribosylformylglycinamidine cyclo-ligase [Candidatus Magnetoovum chiemensis]|nr:phosphoribosylformylglycinamidine cyclo-ligase [Candidatus Magnetoovum chiemensis]
MLDLYDMSDQIPKTYKDAGVDITIGDEASKIMFQASKVTWKNREGLAGQIELARDAFSSVRMIRANGFADAVVGMNLDGVGTKIEIAERINKHTTIAFDLFAMVCDDASANGCEPVLIGSVLDCNEISIPIVKELAKGMTDAAETAKVAVINGEIAELGSRVNGFFGTYAYNWAACAFWIGKEDRIITGKDIKPKDAVIALYEPGLRSNGLSLIRKVFQSCYGDMWHNRRLDKSSLGEAALTPSTIYTPILTALTGGYSQESRALIKGISHITGGGIPSKFGRLLSACGCGAVLDNLFEPSPVMLLCQSLAQIPDYEAYRTWNMGQGALIVCPEPQRILDIASKMKYPAKVAGYITKEPLIKIKSSGYYSSLNDWLTYSIASK